MMFIFLPTSDGRVYRYELVFEKRFWRVTFGLADIAFGFHFSQTRSLVKGHGNMNVSLMDFLRVSSYWLLVSSNITS